MGFGNHSRSYRRRFRRYHSYGLKRCGRVFNGLWLCCCLGPLLLLIGIIVIATAGVTNSRNESIESYNRAVENWRSWGYEKFAGMEGEWSLRFERGGGTFNLTRLTTDAPLRDKGKKGDSEPIQDYSDLYLNHQAFRSLNVAGLCYDSRGCETSPSYGRFTLTSPSGETWVIPMSLFTVETRTVERESECCNGCFYDDWRSECRDYKILEGVSIKVFQRHDMTWAADKRFGGYGAGDSKGWGTGIYRDLRIHCRRSDCMPTHTDVSVILRSYDDPRVQFYDIMGSGHSLNFGTSTREAVTVGIVLTVIGSIMICGVGMAVYGISRCLRGSSNDPLDSSFQSSDVQSSYIPPAPAPAMHYAQPAHPQNPGPYPQNSTPYPQNPTPYPQYSSQYGQPPQYAQAP